LLNLFLSVLGKETELMQAALIYEDNKQQSMLVPKQLVGLAAILLTGSAVTPVNMQAVQNTSSFSANDFIEQTEIIEMAPPIQSNINLKTMEELGGARLYSTVNIQTISLYEKQKEVLQLRDKIVSSVLTWQGVSYLWGGTNRAGVDCSGLVQQVFKENGILLPRTSYEQYRVGVGIPQANLKPGDLVFFNTNGTPASHVGIYIGERNFISATKRIVEIQSLDQPYWQRTYTASRRIID
jgi:lipoprotein Spr